MIRYPEGPTEKQFKAIVGPAIDLIGATAAIKNPHLEPHEVFQRCQSMMKKTEQHDLDVRGNRVNGQDITWADTRLLLAGYLRIILEELEAP